MHWWPKSMPRRYSSAAHRKRMSSPRSIRRSRLWQLIRMERCGARREPERLWNMSASNMSESKSDWFSRWTMAFVGMALIVALVGIGVLLAILGQPPLTLIRQAVDGVFAASSVQAMWYVTRAAGLVSYLLLWL